MLTKNTRTNFYKYLTADSTKAVLRHGTLKWSTPALFNDPFDNQLAIQLSNDFELMAKQSNDYFINAIMGDKPIVLHDPFQSAVMETFRLVMKNKLYCPTEEDLIDFKQAALEGIKTAAAAMEEVNAEIQSKTKDTSIFCMTEESDNILMWSHYSGNHTGAVIQLSPVHHDSFLPMAQRVKYIDKLEKFSVTDFMSPEMPLKVMEYITLTKSNNWAYEKEWRVVSGLRDKMQQYELIPFIREELSAVYLGCRMPGEDKQEISALTRTNFPHAKIYQASKHPTGFDLIFTEEN